MVKSLELFEHDLLVLRYNKLSHGASATKGALVDAGGKTVNAMKSAGSATAKKLGEIR
jgi:hypothetical protein